MTYGRSRSNLALDIMIGLLIGAVSFVVLNMFSGAVLIPLLCGMAVFALYQLWVLTEVTRAKVSEKDVAFTKKKKVIGKFYFSQTFFSYGFVPQQSAQVKLYLIAEDIETGNRKKVDCTSLGKKNFYAMYDEIGKHAQTMGKSDSR